MAHPPVPERIDERLAALLETEQRLEARYRDAEAACRAKLEQARATVVQARDAGLQSVAAVVLEEERQELAAHEAALRALADERALWLSKLSALTEEQLDRLARKALARAIATGSPP